MVSKVITFVIFAFLLAQNSAYSWSTIAEESVTIVFSNMYFYINNLGSNSKESRIPRSRETDTPIVPGSNNMFYSLSTLAHFSGMNLISFLAVRLSHYFKQLILDFAFGVAKLQGGPISFFWQIFNLYITLVSGWSVTVVSGFMFNYVIDAFLD